MTHPREQVLALLAGDKGGAEVGRIRRLLLDRHVRDCADCQEKIAEYQELRAEVAEIDFPDLNWNFLAADMRANIRLGLEAGACVRTTQVQRRWNLRPAIAFACVLLLAGAAELLRDARPHRPSRAESAPVLQTTDSGIEFRTGDNSLMLLNRHGNAANQTVSARGDISEMNIDSDTGAVTINNVSLQ